MHRYSWLRLEKGRYQKGYLLVLVMGISIALMTITLAIMSVSSTKYAKTASDGNATNAIYAAEAGLTDTLNQLNQSPLFGGYTHKQFYSSPEKGKADYTTTIAPGADGTLVVTSTGYVYSTQSSAIENTKRSVRAVLTRSLTPIPENVLAGSAGLTMSGGFFPWAGQISAMQKGSIYSRGKIRLNGSTTNIGATTDSAKVTAANIGCGSGATYPQQCASNDPPLVFGGSTWYSPGLGKVYGTVCATDQPASANILPGPTGSGRIPDCIAPDYGMPYYDKGKFTDTKHPSIPAMVSQCGSGFGLPTPALWAANTRIIGNLTLQGSFWADCTATLTGDLYIKGDLTIGSKARINVAESALSRRPVIVVDGKVTISHDAIGVFANSSGSPVTIISFWSTDSDCRTSDDCTSISPTKLYESSVQGSGFAWYNTGTRAFMIGDPSSYNSTGTQPNLSGLAAYSYFGSTMYALGGNGTMRGIGGQELVINPGGTFNYAGGSLSVTGSFPFASTIQRVKYTVGDYLQVF